MTLAEHYRTGMPARMSLLPIDAAGRPVPKFVEWIDGKPDFRIMSAKHLVMAVRHRLCWVCGHGLGRHLSFTVGPMCLINLISAEPPSHHECATYSATHCPFLTNPERDRRENNLPDNAGKPAGIMIARNPGVTAVITTTRFSANPQPAGLLFQIGEPEKVEWYSEGRPASRDEVEASIASGMPILLAADAGTPEEAEAHQAIAREVAAARRWFPA
jgi:hypothetical protein